MYCFILFFFYVDDKVDFTEHLADLLVSYDLYKWKQKRHVRFVGVFWIKNWIKQEKRKSFENLREKKKSILKNGKCVSQKCKRLWSSAC